MHSIEDLLTHFADEFRATADILKKCRDLKSYKFRNSRNEEQEIKTAENLKRFLQEEIDAYQAALDDI